MDKDGNSIDDSSVPHTPEEKQKTTENLLDDSEVPQTPEEKQKTTENFLDDSEVPQTPEAKEHIGANFQEEAERRAFKKFAYMGTIFSIILSSTIAILFTLKMFINFPSQVHPTAVAVLALVMSVPVVFANYYIKLVRPKQKDDEKQEYSVSLAAFKEIVEAIGGAFKK